jgi:quercetin 2,3-dioxygenase
MTWHTFSFGSHYDPDRVSLGPMVCHDEHLLGDGRGFATHRHSDVAILTWVVSGALRHVDSLTPDDATVLEPGSVGLLYAGPGVDHSEVAVAPQTRFVQAWLGSTDGPSYARVEVPDGPGFREVVRVGDSVMYAATLADGETVAVPPGALRHVFVASGGLLRNSLAEPLDAGDALVFRDETGPAELTAAMQTQLLAWAL